MDICLYTMDISYNGYMLIHNTMDISYNGYMLIHNGYIIYE